MKHISIVGQADELMCGNTSPAEGVRAVVVTVTATLAFVEPSMVIEDGDTEQVAPAGTPEQIHVRVLLNPPLGEIETV